MVFKAENTRKDKKKSNRLLRTLTSVEAFSFTVMLCAAMYFMFCSYGYENKNNYQQFKPDKPDKIAEDFASNKLIDNRNTAEKAEQKNTRENEKEN